MLIPNAPTLNDTLRQALLPGQILDVQVGLTRTAVLVETSDGLRCGLAATLTNPGVDHHTQPAVREAGHLHKMSSAELAGLVESPSFSEVAIGLATINALLPRSPDQWTDLNAGDYLAQHGANQNVVVVGHFPFIDELRPVVKKLWVLELNPRPGDYPASSAPEIIPQADLLAITATTLINRSFQGLLALCRPTTRVVLIGPSAPLSPLLYDFGIQIISGTIVTDPRAVIRAVGQGISFKQMRKQDLVRLVTIQK